MLKSTRQQVFAYMAGIIKNHKCQPFIVNGVEDHVHILTHLHPSVALASLVKDIKMSSHAFIDDHHLFPDFNSWQRGYAAFSYSIEARFNLIRYIERQEMHHQKINFEDEYIALLVGHCISYDKKYLFD
jgi:REP element-mobilizing transposase RayT